MAYHPWRDLDRLDVDVRFAHLEAGELGCFDPDTRTIWLAVGLTQAERRSTLAHELVHVERDHEPCVTPWHERHQERAVELEAARRLIDLDALMDAMAYCLSLEEAAEELHVDADLLRIRISMLDVEDQEIIRRRFAAEWSVC